MGHSLYMGHGTLKTSDCREFNKGAVKHPELLPLGFKGQRKGVVTTYLSRLKGDMQLGQPIACSEGE